MSEKSATHSPSGRPYTCFADKPRVMHFWNRTYNNDAYPDFNPGTIISQVCNRCGKKEVRDMKTLEGIAGSPPSSVRRVA